MLRIEDLLLAAEGVLGIDAGRLAATTEISPAESALASPFAGIGDVEFYEQPIERAAVLASRVMRNHPLADGNKRVALILMRVYLDERGLRLSAPAEEIDVIFRAVAGRERPESVFVAWLRTRAARVDGAG